MTISILFIQDTNMVGNMDTNITENMDIIKENIMENMCINIVEITKDITLFRYSIVDSLTME
jgi:hypothetical protein